MGERERPFTDPFREDDPWESSQPERSSDSLTSGPQLVRLEQKLAELQAEVDHLREDLVSFEDRYRMSLEEFRAYLAPDAEPQLQEDYWCWARCAEECRRLSSQLEEIRSHLAAGKLQAIFRKPPEREPQGAAKKESHQPLPAAKLRSIELPGHSRRRRT